MKFNSKKNKINYIQNSQINNTSIINTDKLKEEIINLNIQQSNKKSNIFQFIREFETDWFPMEFSGSFEEVPDYLVDQHFGLKVEIGEFPENYIPFIKPVLLYRNVTNTNDTTIYPFAIHAIIKIVEDVPNGNQKLTIYSSYTNIAGTYNVPVNNRFEAKLKIQILNPLSV